MKTIYISDDLHGRIKANALKRGMSMTEVAEENLICLFLNRPLKNVVVKTKTKRNGK